MIIHYTTQSLIYEDENYVLPSLGIDVGISLIPTHFQLIMWFYSKLTAYVHVETQLTSAEGFTIPRHVSQFTWKWQNIHQ